jgi:hypothetical protein
MGGKFRIEAEFLDSMPDLGLLSANIPKNEVTISPTNIISSVLPKNPEEPWIINFEVLNNSKNQVSIKFLSDNCNITKDMPESRCRNLLGY